MNKNVRIHKSGLHALSAIILILIMVTGCAGLQKKTNLDSHYLATAEKTELYETIKDEMQAKNITGLSIVVADSKSILWSEGFGLADKKKNKPFNNETISNIGSVSKLITATTIMRLVEAGKIDLDAPVSTYIPEFAPRERKTTWEPITVRMLLNHQSGLESDGFYDFFLGYEQYDDLSHSYRKAVDAVNQCGVVQEPYTLFSYCNLGFSLLGCIIERTHGSDFQTAVKELVLDPIGMNSSSFILEDAPKDKLATGYTSGRPVTVPYIRDMPAGSLNASANDMGLFLQNVLSTYHNDEGLLQRETLLGMFEPSNAEVQNDLDFRTGLTWWIVDLEDLPGEYVLGHGGDLPPFHALLSVLPERDLAVFVMVNSATGVGSFSLTDILTKTVRTFASIKGQAPIKKAIAQSPVIAVPESAKINLPGYYASASGLAEIKLKGDKLKIYAFNNWFDLNTHEDGTMTLGMKLLGIIPLNLPIFEEVSISTERVNNTQSINLRLQGILISPCIKIENVDIDQAWLNRSGKYAPINSEVMPQYTGFKIGLDKKSGFLCLYLESSDGWSKFPLQTEGPTKARLMGMGRGLGGSVIIEENASGETLRFLNFELSKIK